MSIIEWLNERKAYYKRGVEFYQNKVKAYEKELAEVEKVIDVVEGQPVDSEAAQ